MKRKRPEAMMLPVSCVSSNTVYYIYRFCIFIKNLLYSVKTYFQTTSYKIKKHFVSMRFFPFFA